MAGSRKRARIIRARRHRREKSRADRTQIAEVVQGLQDSADAGRAAGEGLRRLKNATGDVFRQVSEVGRRMRIPVIDARGTRTVAISEDVRNWRVVYGSPASVEVPGDHRRVWIVARNLTQFKTFVDSFDPRPDPVPRYLHRPTDLRGAPGSVLIIVLDGWSIDRSERDVRDWNDHFDILAQAGHPVHKVAFNP